jgi:ribose-phosphate pyrophosphokinase
MLLFALDAPLRHIFVTDTVPPFRLKPAFAASRLKIVAAAPLFADCVTCLHDGAPDLTAPRR